ncbi:MAG: hypothetical protein WKG07_15960 [Hymenobacter sp.]
MLRRADGELLHGQRRGSGAQHLSCRRGRPASLLRDRAKTSVPSRPAAYVCHLCPPPARLLYAAPPPLRANQRIYRDYFHEEFTQTLDENILQLLDRVWFRSRASWL